MTLGNKTVRRSKMAMSASSSGMLVNNLEMLGNN